MPAAHPLRPVAMVGMLAAALLAGCGTQPIARPDGHIAAPVAAAAAPAKGAIPEPVRQLPLPPPPRQRVEEIRYSVTVNNVPVNELLFAISRDTRANIDIHPGVEGRVTLNAIDQTLKQILNRISRQVDLRWEMEGPNIVIRPDSPYLKIYKVDFVNITRDSATSIGVQTQVVGPSSVASGGASGSAGGVGQNSSQIRVDNIARNRFWESLEKNIRDLLRETDKLLPEGSSETVVQNRTQQASSTTQAQATSQSGRATGTAAGRVTGPGATDSQVAQESVSQTLTFREAASVIVNPETGTVAVRATSRQHEKVGEFIEQIGGAARRQVLIEATVVEVLLNDRYQSGVDWSALGLQGLGYTFRQNFTTTELGTSPQVFSLQYRNPNAAVGGDISSTIRLLNTFGNSRVLSSPKIMALNNQTAVMRVVENTVYFSIKAEPTTQTVGNTTTTVFTFTSTPNVVPEGFVLNVTPQIGENDIINLNIRPSVTKITDRIRDPNPDLNRTNSVPNFVPQIQTREFETMMRVSSGQIAVLGGLMQDTFQASRGGLPIASRIPVLGDLASYRDDRGIKSELVVFIRATVIREASIESDLADFRKYLPDSQFFKDSSPVLDPMNPDAFKILPAAPEGEPRKQP